MNILHRIKTDDEKFSNILKVGYGTDLTNQPEPPTSDEIDVVMDEAQIERLKKLADKKGVSVQVDKK